MLSIATPHDRLASALEDAGERGELERQLPAYLRSQRWFGGQARELRSVSLERWVELESGACVCAASATDSAGVRTEHQLLLLLGEAQGGRRTVVDALSSGAVRAELLALALSGGRRGGHRAALVFEPLARADGCGGDGRPIGVEQSNSSVVYDDACILKVYRRLEQGHNPEVELGRYLTREAGFTAAPRVLVTARLEGPGGYGTDALMVQEYVRNQGDGWAWAVAAAERALASVEAPVRMDAWLRQEGRTLEGAQTLGETTARLHAALASATPEGLRPAPVTERDLLAWSGELRQEARLALATLERAGLDDRGLSAAIRAIADGGGGSGLRLTASTDAGLKMRVHGDYHLGQVLRTDGGFMVLDFEGEPARTLPERRALQHALVDVAGMLRSWGYAAHTGARAAGTPDLAAAWETAVRRRFLAAYWETAASARPQFLPGAAETRGELLALFELRKALYEVRYELNYRPGWVDIPASAVRRLATLGDR